MALSDKQIEKFKRQLLELKTDLSRHLRGTSEEVKNTEEGKGYSQHQADEGTDDFDRVISLALSDQELKILRQVERALEKMEEGSYGTCDLTGDAIPLKRLEAIPYATLTRDAQERMEQGLL